VGSVGTFLAGLFTVRGTDLIGLTATWTRPQADALGLVTFPVPLDLPPLRMGIAWHPRHEADPAHAWLRQCVRELMTQASSSP
jgi:DNA-binding transcriptional LysR family regulator